jgi:hypothetical protein
MVVYAKAPFVFQTGVEYLGRYTHGWRFPTTVCLSSRMTQSHFFPGRTIATSPRTRPCLDAHELFADSLMHVLPSGFQRIQLWISGQPLSPGQNRARSLLGNQCQWWRWMRPTALDYRDRYQRLTGCRCVPARIAAVM